MASLRAPDARATLSYIEDLLVQLAEMASGEGRRSLATAIRMAALEAARVEPWFERSDGADEPARQ